MALFIFWKKLGSTAAPATSRRSEGIAGFFSHMILPWFVLALLYMAIYARMTRNNLLETLGEDYIRTARAKGLTGAAGDLQARPAREPDADRDDVRPRHRPARRRRDHHRVRVQHSRGSAGSPSTARVNQDLPSVLGVVMLGAVAVAMMNLSSTSCTRSSTRA